MTPRRAEDSTELDDEPPPYTPRPSTWNGETTVEQGPSRPFQPAPQNQTATIHQSTTGSPSLSSLNRSAGSLLNQFTTTLTNTVNAAINNLNSPPLVNPQQQQPRPQQVWTSYPGQRHYNDNDNDRPPPVPSRPPRRFLTPPPRHPSTLPMSPSPSTLSPRSASSDFARDFYAAGPLGQGVYDPPPPHLPPRPPPHPTTASASSSSIPNDGRPTSHPALGHPLLKDGKLLVYPKGFECTKCHNIGYKDADPLRPCKKCWSKYAKPFSGPLLYSFPSPPHPSTSPNSTSTTQNQSTNNNNNNFQRPLPHPPPPQPPPIPPALSFNPPPAHFAAGGYMTDHHGGFYSPPPSLSHSQRPTYTRGGGGGTLDIPEISRPPPPGAIVYTAGDPRIGGRLCWRCDGKGNVSYMILDRITCPVCGGVGRTFD